MGDGSPGSREAEGEGDEGFNIAPKRQMHRFTCNLGVLVGFPKTQIEKSERLYACTIYVYERYTPV